MPSGTPLPHAPRPVLRVASTARILVAGQAPGTRVHASGLPFTDPSGDRLRNWMGVDKTTFYDVRRIAIIPMGFCFPGLDAKGADLPPRRECVRTWHDALFATLPPFRLVLAVGRPAQAYHLRRLGLGAYLGSSLTETVQNWRAVRAAGLRPRQNGAMQEVVKGGPVCVYPLPHPSWRNSGWLKRNPFFETEVLPQLQADIQALLGPDL
ncbi:uracil-DNA glycosylase family protein [Xanthobacter sp. TB0139]|uniref:uracil-DNA glycosylase family protein n=1 Tax=Xanthobacter sp. TB0139 TaxID=3459178 RepID=UPI0040394B1B